MEILEAQPSKQGSLIKLPDFHQIRFGRPHMTMAEFTPWIPKATRTLANGGRSTV